MPYRLSTLFLRTLREDPADAEVDSHKLLVRAGYIRRSGPGIFSWLPLGLMVKNKIEKIVREEMAAAGSQEVHFPALLPKEPYEATGRWEEYGDNIFRLKDRKDADYLLAPTHEEVFTLLVKDLYTSYKDLPLSIYQIQIKYRDEARPRAGLLRGREFVMKDAYSFDADEAGAKKSYEAMVGAYRKIFERTGLKALQVEADTGVMGGASSHEFNVPAEIGEGEVVTEEGGSYVATIEKAEGKPAARQGAGGNLEKFPTPGIRTIADLEKKHGVAAQDQVKTLVFTNGKETALVLVRGDDEAQESKVARALGSGYRTATDAEIKEAMGASPGSLGAVGSTLAGKKVTVVADLALQGQAGMATGANENGFHFKGVEVERDLKIDRWADVRTVREGDVSSGGKKLKVSRGIEVGHAFLLGTKYSVAMGAKFLDPHGKEQPAVMGCYGIGVTRTLQAVIEVHHDKDGIQWPAAVAPYTVMVVTLDLADAAVKKAADEVMASLEKAGVDYLWDDRDERPGVKFKDADLLGFPWRITLGAKSLAAGGVEIKCRRTGAMEVVPPGQAGAWIENKLKS